MDEFQLAEYQKRSFDWLKSTVVSRTYPPSYSHNRRKKHGGIKPPELCLELIYAFGKQAKYILDPFAGVGSSLIAASLASKSAIGIEINSEWQQLYYEVCEENKIKPQKFLVGDSRKLILNLKEKIDFVLTDIPYFSMDKLKKTRGRFSRAGEKSGNKLPSSLNVFNKEPIPTYNSWIELLHEVFSGVYRILLPSSFALIFIGNMYRNVTEIKNGKKKKIGKYHLLAAELANVLKKIGFHLITELIWMDTGKKLGIYGYPYVWIPSIVDQRILVMYKGMT